MLPYLAKAAFIITLFVTAIIFLASVSQTLVAPDTLAAGGQGGATSFLEGLRQAKNVDPTLGAAEVEPNSIIESVINWILGISAVVALAVIIIGGFMYIISLGDENRAALAKRIVFYAIIGLLIIGLSFFIINEVNKILTGGHPSDLPPR
ncbi:MAG: pilin [Acidobacteriota bacterium]